MSSEYRLFIGRACRTTQHLSAIAFASPIRPSPAIERLHRQII